MVIAEQNHHHRYQQQQQQQRQHITQLRLRRSGKNDERTADTKRHMQEMRSQLQVQIVGVLLGPDTFSIR